MACEGRATSHRTLTKSVSDRRLEQREALFKKNGSLIVKKEAVNSAQN